MNEKMKLLYIDSDTKYGQKLLTNFINYEYSVKFVNNLKEALIELSHNIPEAIITDLKLEDGMGLDLIEKIKSENQNIKTFILTPQAETEDLIKAISLKVDKVMFKNISFEEIHNEIKKFKSLDKVIKEENPSLLNLGEDYYYDPNNQNIIKENQLIKLTKQENELISELIKANGHLVTFPILQKKIAKDDEATLDTLRTVIRKIRRKAYPEMIRNHSGIGYSINIPNKSNLENRYKLLQQSKNDINVLIVKGEKKDCDLITHKLQKLGYECESTYTLFDAKILLENKKYEYLILELNLPDGDAIDYIRTHEDIIGTKIIVLSSNMDVYYKDYLYFKGIVDYIVENKDIDYLVYNIHKTISKINSNYQSNSNILVIEQSKRICEQIKDLLQPRNYKISVINDINQASDLIKTNLFSLIILDINYTNSFDFMLNIHSTMDENLPFVLLTDTNRTYDLVREAYVNGAKECLRKPIFAEEFILKIDQILEYEKLLNNMKKQKELLLTYQKIVDKTTIISKTNTKGIITYANKRFCEISGYCEEELIGKSHNIIRHPNTDKGTFEELWKTIKDEKRIWSGIIQNKKKDGGTYIVQTYIMPILDNHGEVTEYIALRNDITDIYQIPKNF